LAVNNFNLVLMGSEKDVEITRDKCESINKEIEILCIDVDWRKEE